MRLDARLRRLEKAAPARRPRDWVALRIIFMRDPDERRAAFLSLPPLEQSNDLFDILKGDVRDNSNEA